MQDAEANVVVTPLRSISHIAHFHHIFLLGVAIKLGGCVASWHNGYVVGFWGYFMTCLFIASGYICLNLCVAEITSITMFPGGHFGYVRASIGPFGGYMSGMMSILESCFFLAVSILKLGQACTIAFGTNSHYEFLWWFIAYSVMMSFHIHGGLTLWRFMSLCTVITVLTLFIYLFGSIPAMDFPRYAYGNSKSGFTGDALDYFLAMRLPSWLFVGIDLLPLTSEEVNHAGTNIPHAILAVTAVVFVVSVWLQFTVAGQAPGLVEDFFDLDNIFPLSHGFGRIFNISSRWGTAFSILPCFTSCFGFMFVSSRQVHAMARSGLLPEVFTVTYGVHGTPVVAMLVVTLIGLVSLPFAWVYDPYTLLFRMAVSAGCVTYILVLLAFIQFRTTYSHMGRRFTNPLGIASAVFGIFVFAVEEISVLFILALQVNFHQTIAFACILVAVAAYYYWVARYHQTFSPEEQATFLRTYIINANLEAKRKKRYGVFSPHKATGAQASAKATAGAGTGGWYRTLSHINASLSLSRRSWSSNTGSEMANSGTVAGELRGAEGLELIAEHSERECNNTSDRMNRVIGDAVVEAVEQNDMQQFSGSGVQGEHVCH